MVIDTSALAAIFFGEPEGAKFLDAVARAGIKLISAATVLEAGMVIEARYGEAAGSEFDLFLVRGRLEVVPFDAEQAELARSAWRKYGKGRHSAGLNFGDCFSYALAKSTGEPLLAKGSDFPKTDAPLFSLTPKS